MLLPNQREERKIVKCYSSVMYESFLALLSLVRDKVNNNGELWNPTESTSAAGASNLV